MCGSWSCRLGTIVCLHYTVSVCLVLMAASGTLSRPAQMWLSWQQPALIILTLPPSTFRPSCASITQCSGTSNTFNLVSYHRNMLHEIFKFIEFCILSTPIVDIIIYEIKPFFWDLLYLNDYLVIYTLSTTCQPPQDVVNNVMTPRLLRLGHTRPKNIQ